MRKPDGGPGGIGRWPPKATWINLYLYLYYVVKRKNIFIQVIFPYRVNFDKLEDPLQ